MKKYLAARKCASAILLAGALGTFTFVVPQVADAQNASEKIKLMAQTLRARDSGDLALAKQKAEELIRVAPQDQNVQHLLASINKDLDREQDGNSIYGQASTASVEAAIINAPEVVEAVEITEAPAGEAANEAESIVAAAAADQDAKLAAAENAIDEADKLAELGAYADATNLLNAAAASLTLNTSTADVLDDIDAAKADVVLTEAKALAAAGDAKAAEALLEEYRAAGGRSKAANALAVSLDKQISNPYELAIQDISPDYVSQSKIVRDLLTR